MHNARGSFALALVTALFLVVRVSHAEPGPGYQEELKAARAAREAKDWAGYKTHLLKVYELLAGHPDTIFALGRAEALLGNNEAALEWLQSFAGLGLIRDLAAEKELEPLRSMPGYADLTARLEQNRKPLSRGTVAFTLPDAELLVEDLAYDPVERVFYASSIHKRKILRIAADGKASDFVVEGRDGIWAVLALALDAERRQLWATTSAMPQALGHQAAEAGRSALLRYDLKSGALLGRHDVTADGAEHSLGDMTLDPATGTLYLSDSESGALYTLRPQGESLEVLLPAGSLASPQGLTLAPDGKRLFAADYVRGIAVVDLTTRSVGWLEAPKDVTLHGIDGLLLAGTSLIAVQNGVQPQRLIRLALDAELRRVQSAELLESNSLGLSPTHALLTGPDLYFIANSGWDQMGGEGTFSKEAPPEPARILRLSIGLGR